MKKFGLSGFSVSDSGSMATVVEEEVAASTLTEAKESPQLKEVMNNHVDYHESMARVRKSQNTEVKIAADKALDDAWVGTRQMVWGHTYSPDPAVAQKAHQLYAVLDTYGAGVEELSGTEESEKIDTILVKLLEPANLQLAVDLGVKPFVDHLKVCAQNFRRDWGSLEADKEAFRNSLSATNSRRKLEASIVAFYEYVDYGAKFAPTKREEWAKLESAIYSRYTTIRQKYAETKKKKTDPTKPTTPDTGKK
ncbi:DUF6261 family protein [uncultured Acetobacteroides sp.]|uniref:DUF6261 family protein n=1 Tax=uncultured Acetobacteroides sp. TaxID=1760811 RepID=UPI0029F5C69F|nr:DUF6261 family protein [uncultured Acetobacteroides sp.]